LGLNQDKWIMNPACDKLDMYTFLGKIIGIAIRNKIFLNLNLPMSIWKMLVDQPLSATDLEAIDKPTSNVLENLQKPDDPKTQKDLDSELVDEAIRQSVGTESFTCVLSDGMTAVELLRGGSHKKLTSANRKEWAQLVLTRRLHESDMQVAALRDGLATVVPIEVLSMFTAEELDSLICGKPDFNVELLKSVTQYQGSQHEDLPHIQWFWATLTDFSPQQKAQFLRFAWARTRLPPTAAQFITKFKIQDPKVEFLKHPDKHFPHVSTCFFSIMIPPYSSRKVLQEKLIYAMDNCTSMDADVKLKDSELYNYEEDTDLLG